MWMFFAATGVMILCRLSSIIRFPWWLIFAPAVVGIVVLMILISISSGID